MRHDDELSRRKFIQLAMMSSAMLMTSGAAIDAIAEDANAATYGALKPLAPGAIQPGGWLRGYMEKQAAQLGSQLPNVSWPFTDAYWAGEEEAESWWPWEQKAYWVDGATRLAIVLQDKELMQRTQSIIDFTLAHPAPNGYLGPSFFEEDTGNCSRWPQTVFFRALAANADALTADSQKTDPQKIAEAMRRHYVNDTASYGKPVRNVTNVEAMLWCYERTGDPRLLVMAENAWNTYLTVAGEEGHGDLSPMRVYSAGPIYSHGVTYAEESKLPAILYLHTGKPEYLKFAHAAQRRIFDHHMLIDGIPSTSEWFETRTSLDTHETCDITDHTWTWGYMMMASGEGVWGDRIERACFNAGPGAIKNDWKALQYFSGPNQFLATMNSDHNRKSLGGYQMAYQPNPGKRTACCGGNVHRLMPNYALRMWMTGRDGSLAATLYGPSKLNATVGAENEPVEIMQTTDYPFDERIQFRINAQRAVTFPLLLRIPAWCERPHLTVNGKTVDAQPARNGFITLQRKFNPGDTVTLTLPMKPAVSHWPQNGIGIEHGPLVYSLAIQENWAPVAEPKYATPEFPGWNATPASAWNYGIALKEGPLEDRVKFERKPVGNDPWTNPPVSLSIAARKIQDWELQSNPGDPSQKFTPPLPELSESKISDVEETITLVPYGSTQLRVTIFPALETT